MKLFRHTSLILFMSIIVFACTSQSPDIIAISVQELKTNTTAGFRGLFVVSENVVWASGTKGTVLKTVDGGSTWEQFQIPTTKENQFRSIHAWNENEAIVFGISGPNFGYKTIDGGKLWKLVYSNTSSTAFFNSVKFANDSIGLAVSDAIDNQLYIIKTTDRGETWKRVENTPLQLQGEFNFAASNTCIEFLPSGKAWIATGGSVARVFKSNDFSETWNAIETQFIAGNQSTGIFSISFIDDLHGCIVGGTYDQPELNKDIAAYTNDGGLTWKLSTTMPAEFRSCVQTVKNSSSEFLFTTGKTGCDYSTDRGKNWNFIDSTGYYTFRAIPNHLAGYAAGENGLIAKITFK